VSTLTPFLIDKLVEGALREDVGRGDLTTTAVVPQDIDAHAVMTAKAEGVIAGLDLVRAVYRHVDPEVAVQPLVNDGDRVRPGDRVLEARGPARSLLIGERVALNFVQRLSGIATATRRAVDAVAGTKARIVDTRKTTPGLRILEKYAVRAGGGHNHRFGLDDAVMIKENHIAVAGGIIPAVEAARRAIGHMHKIEVEIASLDQIDEAIASGADVILLDNMSIEQMREAVERIGGRAIVEASGGIRPDNVRAVAETGVDVISLGWITHSAPALDLSLLIHPILP